MQGVGLAGSFTHLVFSGSGPTVGDIFLDRPAKKHHFLRHDGHHAAQGGERVGRHVHAVNRNFAVLRIVKAHQ